MIFIERDMDGPFSTEDISEYVDSGYVGVYILSRDGRNVDYVGRSDSDIQGRLRQSISEGVGYYLEYKELIRNMPKRKDQLFLALDE